MAKDQYPVDALFFLSMVSPFSWLPTAENWLKALWWNRRKYHSKEAALSELNYALLLPKSALLIADIDVCIKMKEKKFEKEEHSNVVDGFRWELILKTWSYGTRLVVTAKNFRHTSVRDT